MKKNHKGIFFLIVAALLLTGCPDPNKNGDSPAVAGPTRTDIAFSDDKLEITFDKELKAFDAKKITVILDNSVIPATAYTLSVSGTKLVMTFTANPGKGQKYKVTLKAGAVTGKDGGTTKKEDSAGTTFGVPLAFQSMAFSSEKKLELTFNQTLDKASTSHPDPSKITITRAGKKLSATDYSLSIDDTRLVITFKVNATLNQQYTVALGEGAVKGNKLSSLAVSPAKEITFGVTPPPAYTGIAQNNNKIELSFNKNLANGSPNPTHITVTRTRGEGASETLTIGTDYSLSIAGKKLVITLKFKTPSNIAGEYTVALAKGAVKSVDGKFSEAVSSNPSIPMYNLPDTVGAPVFETSSTKLVATFNTGLASISADGITVESKANEEENDNAYANVAGAMAALDKTDSKKVIITLPNPATELKVYRVVVAIGGVTATEGGVSNITKLESAGVAYSINPALVGTPPYILGKKLTATFNMNIALVAGNKVEVYKGSAKPGTKVDGTTASVNTTDKTLLEITLPAGDTSATGDVYRLKLLKDAVSKDGDAANKNAEFTSPDITILAAPAVHATNTPYRAGDKIHLTFNDPIELLDASKVKVKSDADNYANALGTTAALNSDDTQVVITLDDGVPANGVVYRVAVDAGAVGRKNTVSPGAIATTGAGWDITVADGPALEADAKPVFSSNQKFSIIFDVNVLLLNADAVKVEKKSGAVSFAALSTADRSLEVDSTNTKKINVTLTGEAATGSIWKVSFPVDTVLDLASRNANRSELVTGEGTVINYKHRPKDETELLAAIKTEITVQKTSSPDLNNIDTSQITDMTDLFKDNTTFNGDISKWDVSKVSNMQGMFNGAGSFNQDISGWGDKTGQVIDMSYMFANATSFNQDISGWDVSKVTNMYYMFDEAKLFNQDISGWDVSKVTDMNYMFNGAVAFKNGGQALDWGDKTGKVTNMQGMFGMTSFNQDISDWDVNKVTDMNNMFNGAVVFKNGGQALDWGDKTGKVTNMQGMFFNAKSFNQDISGWDVGKVTDMNYMFNGASAFNNGGQALDWGDKTGKVTNMQKIFADAKSFNQDISGWDVNKVTDMNNMFNGAVAFNNGEQALDWGNKTGQVIDMQEMFRGATSFNQDISSWDVSKVPSMQRMFFRAVAFNNGGKALDWGDKTDKVIDMQEMFRGATSFNQDISSWDVSKVPSMQRMFFRAVAFNNGEQALDWGNKTGKVTNMQRIFADAKSFNQDISGWDVRQVTSMQHMFREASVFNNGGQALDWGDKTGKVTNMQEMFRGAKFFNQDISDWDVRQVTSMQRMFFRAVAFNNGGKALDWGDKTGKVTDMTSMFNGATSFNQDISGWDVRQVIYMPQMFYSATSFNQDISGWEVVKVADMNIMFQNATAFTYNLEEWKEHFGKRKIAKTYLFRNSGVKKVNKPSWYTWHTRRK